MKYRRLLAACMFMLPFLNGLVIAQTNTTQGHRLTLADVWTKAVINNKKLRIQQQQVAAAEEETKDALTDRLPEINVNAQYARTSGMPVFENGLLHSPSKFPIADYTYGFGGDAYLNLYSGNKTSLNIEQKKTLTQVKQLQAAQTQADVKLQAAFLYLQLQKSIMFRQLLVNDIAYQKKQLQKIEQLRKNGVVLKSDVLRAQLQLSRQQLSLNTINNDIIIANHQLDVSMGEAEDFKIQPDSISLADTLNFKRYEDYLTEAYHNAFTSKIAEQETHLRQLQLKTVKGNNMPSLGLFANYKLGYPQNMFYPYSPYVFGLGLAGIKASFSISSLYTNKHKVKSAQLQLKTQEIVSEDIKNEIMLKVNSTYLRLQEALAQVKVAQDNVKQATENSRIINNTYFNQTSLITDLLDANNALLQTRFELAAAQIAVQMQYYQLQNAIGN